MPPHRWTPQEARAIGRAKGGRPRKGLSLGDVLKEKLNEDNKGRIVDTLISMASKGDIAAIKLIFERTEGAPGLSEQTRETIRREAEKVAPITGMTVEEVVEQVERYLKEAGRGASKEDEFSLVAARGVPVVLKGVRAFSLQ